MRTKHMCVLIQIRNIMVRLVLSNMFKPCSNFLTDHSKTVLLLCNIFVICVSCLSLSYYLKLLPCGNSLGTDLLALWYMIFFLVFLSLFHKVSWVRCGNWFYRLLTYFVNACSNFTAGMRNSFVRNCWPNLTVMLISLSILARFYHLW